MHLESSDFVCTVALLLFRKWFHIASNLILCYTMMISVLFYMRHTDVHEIQPSIIQERQ